MLGDGAAPRAGTPRSPVARPHRRARAAAARALGRPPPLRGSRRALVAARAHVRRGLSSRAQGAAAHRPFERGLAAEQLGLAGGPRAASRRAPRTRGGAPAGRGPAPSSSGGRAGRSSRPGGAPALRGRRARARPSRTRSRGAARASRAPRRARTRARAARSRRASSGAPRARATRPRPPRSRRAGRLATSRTSAAACHAARAHLHRTAIAPGRRELELPPRQPRPPELQRRAPGDQPRVERLHLPPDGLERPQRPLRREQRRLEPRPLPRRAAPSPRRHRRAPTSRPARPPPRRPRAPGRRQPGRCWRVKAWAAWTAWSRAAAVSPTSSSAWAASRRASARSAPRPAAASSVDGRVGVRLGLGGEPRGQQHFAAVHQQQRERDAVGAVLGFDAVVPLQGQRDVAAPGGDPAEVVADLGRGERLADRLVELLGQREVGLGGAQARRGRPAARRGCTAGAPPTARSPARRCARSGRR